MLVNSLLTVQSPSDWQLSVVLIVQVRWLASVDPDRHNYGMTATVECNATWNVRLLSESTNPRIP